jgi:hypothetical protein
MSFFNYGTVYCHWSRPTLVYFEATWCYITEGYCLQTHHHENLKSHTDEVLFNNFVAIFCMCVCDKYLTLISLQYLKFYMTILVNISPFLWVLTCYVRASMSVGDGQASTVVYYKEIPTYCVSRLSIFDLETTRGWNFCYLFHIIDIHSVKVMLLLR